MTDKPPRIVVTPPMLIEYPQIFLPLAEIGVTIVFNTGSYPMSAKQLAAFIGDADGAIVGLDDLSAEVFAACPRLRIVARNGVGMDNVDMPAATRQGVLVTAPLGANSTSVAELTFGLLLALARRIVPTHNRVQKGVWLREPGLELAGRTLGIIGLGRIGKKVALRAQAFEMRVIAQDIAPDEAFAHQHNISFTNRETLLATADVVSLHVPLTELTYHLINAAALRQMKPGALLLNTARGAVVDTEALAAALDNQQLGGAAFDVHPHEGTVEACLLNRENVITTTHLGSYTHAALMNTARVAVMSLAQYWQQQTPEHLMNPDVLESSGVLQPTEITK